MSGGISSSVDVYVLRRILEACGRPPVQLVLGRGPAISPQHSDPVGSICIRDRATLAELLMDPEVAFGDAYADRRIELQGDLVSVLEAVYRAWPENPPGGWLARLFSGWLSLVQRPTLRRARQNIHYHYDLGNDFYKLWLDRELVYTYTYFPTPRATLEQAQIAKMDHVCRKLCLRPGEKVVEAGCGWGSLALHMARYYGVTVQAFNIAHEQIRYARERAAREGLDHRVEFIEDDYRNIRTRADVFASIGMLEHVGLENYDIFAEVIRRVAGDAGRGLLHFIGRNTPRPLSAWIRKRIFPGAYPPTLREASRLFEPCDYSVLDVENLRLHYARTLEHWLQRFENSYGRAARMFDDTFLRAWRLYLAGSAVAFRTGSLQLFQVLFAGRACDRIPWTRDHVYGRRDEESWSVATSSS